MTGAIRSPTLLPFGGSSFLVALVLHGLDAVSHPVVQDACEFVRRRSESGARL